MIVFRAIEFFLSGARCGAMLLRRAFLSCSGCHVSRARIKLLTIKADTALPMGIIHERPSEVLNKGKSCSNRCHALGDRGKLIDVLSMAEKRIGASTSVLQRL